MDFQTDFTEVQSSFRASMSESEQTFSTDFNSTGTIISGTSNHADLEGRDEANQHPINAITGLQSKLNNLESGSGGYINPYVNGIMDDGGGTAVSCSDSTKSCIDTIRDSNRKGLFTVYVSKNCPDNPEYAVSIKSSLRGLCHVTLTAEENLYMYAWIILFDQEGNFYTRYTSAAGDGEWKKH